MKHFNIPLKVVAMKVDKVSKNNHEKNVKQIIKTLNIENENDLILFSTITKIGRSESFEKIEKYLEY